MTLRTEPVEGAAHVEFFLCLHVKERQIHRRAARVAALLADIVFLEKTRLVVDVGIEIGLHLGSLHVGSPTHEVIDGLLRAIGIIDLQAVALCFHVVARLLQGCSGLLGQEGCRLLVPIDTSTHEIIGAEVAYLQDSIGHGIRQGYKLAAVVSRVDHGVVAVTVTTGHHTRAANNCKDSGYHPNFLLFHRCKFTYSRRNKLQIHIF